MWQEPKIDFGYTKASELVPCSLLPHWNSMRFFATVSLSDMASLQEVKFSTLYRQSSTRHEYCNLYVYYVVITSRTCQHWNFQKADFEP